MEVAKRKSDSSRQREPVSAVETQAYVNFWRVNPNFDHEGAVAHHLGHVLANQIFNEGIRGERQAWIGEGAGYYNSFEFLGRNTVTCKAFDEREYDRDPGEEGEKEVVEGMREAFNRLAIKKGLPIEELARKTLFQMDNADLAKSWSLFDWFAERDGIRGIRFLQLASRNTGASNRDGATPCRNSTAWPIAMCSLPSKTCGRSGLRAARKRRGAVVAEGDGQDTVSSLNPTRASSWCASIYVRSGQLRPCGRLTRPVPRPHPRCHRSPAPGSSR